MENIPVKLENPPRTDRRVNLLKIVKELNNAPKYMGVDWYELHVFMSSRMMKIEKDLLAANADYNGILMETHSGKYQIKIRNKSNRFYLFHVELYYNGDLFGCGFGYGRKNCNGIQPDSWMLKIENKSLYKYTIGEINTILSGCPFLRDIKKIIRLDVFVDINKNVNKEIWDYLKGHLNDNQIQLIRNHQMDIYGWNAQDEYPESVMFGKNSSDTQLIIYNKKKEVAVTGKAYILEAAQKNGLNVADDVFRIEARFKGDIIEVPIYQMVKDGEINEILKSLFAYTIDNKMTFLIVAEKTSRRYWERVKLLTMRKMNNVIKKLRKTETGASIWLFKILINKFLDKLYNKSLSRGEVIIIFRQVMSTIQNDYIKEWLNRKLNSQIQENTENEKFCRILKGFLNCIKIPNISELLAEALTYQTALEINPLHKGETPKSEVNYWLAEILLLHTI